MVFCCARLKLPSDALLGSQTRSPHRHLASPRPVPVRLSTRLLGLGRLFFQPAACPGWNLLLRLFAGQVFRRLRKNVRTAQVRFALVGRNLQKTSLQCSRGNARRRPSRTSPRAFRARLHQVNHQRRIGAHHVASFRIDLAILTSLSRCFLASLFPLRSFRHSRRAISEISRESQTPPDCSTHLRSAGIRQAWRAPTAPSLRSRFR